MAITIEPQMLIDVLFPSGTTSPRKSYRSKSKTSSVEWSIELPDVSRITVSSKVRLAAVLYEAPCLNLKQTEISKLLEIDRSNFSRWRWKRDAEPDKYRTIWRNTTITLVAIYFRKSREVRLSRDIFSYMQMAINEFATVTIEDIFEWRGERNMPSSKYPLPYADSFVEILTKHGLLIEREKEKALELLSHDFEATIGHFQQKGLTLSKDQIATLLRAPTNPHFFSGLSAYGQYIRLRTGKPPAPKKTPENKQKPVAATQGSLNPAEDRE